MLHLDQAPPGVSEERWRNPLPAASPSVGELWLLSWDGTALGLAAITRTTPEFVVCWPVTFSDAPVFAPALEVSSSELGASVLAWPTRETGVGMHLLHRRFGTILSPETIALVDSALQDEPEGELPLPLAPITVEGVDAERASDAMVDEWESICLNVWPMPVPGVAPLSEPAIRALGLQVTDLAQILDVEVPAAVSYLRGEHVLNVEQLERLARSQAVEPVELLATGDEESATLLGKPRFKDSFVQLASQRSVSEDEVRHLVRTDMALAARSDGNEEERVEAIIDRLGRQDRA